MTALQMQLNTGIRRLFAVSTALWVFVFTHAQQKATSEPEELCLPGYSEVTAIPHSNGRYLLCQKNDTCSYVYDNKKKKAFPTIYNHEGRVYENLFYLGMRNKEPVFHNYANDMFGLNGFYAELNAEGIELNNEAAVDDKLSLHYGEDREFVMPLNKIPTGYRVVFDLDYNKESLHCISKASCSDSISGHTNEAYFFICVPKLNDFTPDVKSNILYWILDCYAASKGTDRICDVTQVRNENELIASIKKYFTENEIQNNFDELFRTYLLYKSADYASFHIEYYVKGEIKCSYAATFDLARNRRLTLSDIINNDGKQKVQDMLRDYYFKDLNISTYVMPVAITKYGLQFYMGEREPSFEAVVSTNVSISNPDMQGAVERLQSPFIPYSYIDQYMKINVSEECETMNDHIQLVLEPMEEEITVISTASQTYMTPKSQKEYSFEATINGGYNRNHAKHIQKEHPELAVEIYSSMLEEFQTTTADQLIRSNYYYSNVLTAQHHYQQGDLQTAESICRRTLNEMPVDTIRPLSTNYSYYLITNLILGTKSHTYNDSIRVYDYSTEEGYNAYIDALILLSKIRQSQKDIEGEKNYSLKAINLLIPYLRQIIPSLSKGYKDQLWQHYRNWLLSDALLLALRSHDNRISQAVYNALLFGKGLLLNSEVALVKHIMNSENLEAKNDLTEYYQTRESIERCRILGQTQKMAELMSRLDALSEHLMNDVGFYNYMYTQNTSVTQVADNLREKESAIEFIDVTNNNDTIFYALVLNYGSNIPTIVRICSIQDLKKINKEDISNGNLYRTVWKPLEAHISLSKNIFFSPSGILHTLPIESATSDKVNESLHLCRLSSTREIALARDTIFKVPLKGKRYALLIGGLNYDNRSANYNQSDDNRISFVRSAVRLDEVEPLPATQKEINAIQSFFSHIENVDSIVKLSDESGTESAFRYYSKYPISIVHIATHGFYLSDADYEKLDKDNYISLLGKTYRDVEEKGLIRSGLLFAGVNSVFSDNNNASSSEDGIMTGMEISSIDLNNVELAVLSACQTGLGDITDDGVIGLQRGFKKAGVNSILMSLWKVDDDATYLFMTKFYEVFSKYQDKQKALEAARKHLKEHTKYNDSEYWAPFILLDAISYF